MYSMQVKIHDKELQEATTARMKKEIKKTSMKHKVKQLEKLFTESKSSNVLH